MVYLGLPIKNADFPWQTVSHSQMVNGKFALPSTSIIFQLAGHLKEAV